MGRKLEKVKSPGIGAYFLRSSEVRKFYSGVSSSTLTHVDNGPSSRHTPALTVPDHEGQAKFDEI